jgi:hypothetical protein
MHIRLHSELKWVLNMGRVSDHSTRITKKRNARPKPDFKYSTFPVILNYCGSSSNPVFQNPTQTS